MQARLDRMRDAMGVRRQTVEHPFGTFKSWMGSTHFLTRMLKRVRTEMSLHVLSLQHEAGDRYHRCRTAAASNPGLSARRPATAWTIEVSLPSSANAFL